MESLCVDFPVPVEQPAFVNFSNSRCNETFSHRPRRIIPGVAIWKVTDDSEQQVGPRFAVDSETLPEGPASVLSTPVANARLLFRALILDT